MPTPRRQITDGLLPCSKCRENKPYWSFRKDSHQSSGRGSVCEDCRSPKRKSVELDYEVVPSSSLKTEKYAEDRATDGAWERIVRHAGILTRSEAIVVNVGRGYREHYSTHALILRAARKLKIKVVLDHHKTTVSVRNGRSAL